MRCAILVIIALAIVGFILDSLSNKCTTTRAEGAAVVFTHHFIFTFSLFGWLFDDPALLILYISLLPIVWLHWKTSDRCFVDNVTTTVCGEATDFQHLGRQFGLPQMSLAVLAWVGVVIAGYKLYWILTRRPRGPITYIPPIWKINKVDK